MGRETWLVTGGAYKFHIHKGSILSMIGRTYKKEDVEGQFSCDLKMALY